MTRILGQQAQMAVHLPPFLDGQAAVRSEEPLGSLQFHPARSRLALVFRVELANQFLDAGKPAGSPLSFIALGLENAADFFGC